jgi:hypothetical protein
MGQIKLTTKLPKEATGNNGLDSLVSEIIKQPQAAQCVIGWVTAPKTEIDHNAENYPTPKVEFGHIEGVLDAEDREVILKMLMKYRKKRVGEPIKQPTLDEGYAEELSDQRARERARDNNLDV